METVISPADIVSNEARHLRNAINSGISNRKHHPTYGYTKAGLLSDYHRLEGLCYAYEAIVDGASSASFHLQAIDGARNIGFNLSEIRTAIATS